MLLFFSNFLNKNSTVQVLVPIDELKTNPNHATKIVFLLNFSKFKK